MSFKGKHFTNADPKEIIRDTHAGILARERNAGLIYYAQDLNTY